MKLLLSLTLILLQICCADAGASGSNDWYLGKWKVIDASFPGISAMDMDEARAWFGSVAVYTNKLVSFREEVCVSPSYKINNLSEGEFYTDYKVTFKQLDIEAKSVDVLEVGCPENWTAAGSALIKADGRSGYLLWDGVFFRVNKIAP